MARERIYRVIFHSQGKVYEIYASEVTDGPMLGFVQVAQLSFGERSQLVVDPSEEKLKSEFSGVSRTLIPMHSVIRIDEVEKQGVAKITDADGKVTPFPMPFYGGPDRGGERR